MLSETIELGRWQDTVRRFLPRELKSVFAGGSQREILKQAGAMILVFDDCVMDLASGRQSRALGGPGFSAETLAQTVSDLLSPGADDNSVVLLLPPGEFAATSVVMPGMGRDSLVSALQLQAPTLLPCSTERLAVVANPHGTDDSHPDVALWIPERRLDELYQAFEQQGLFLSGVLPRCLALGGGAAEREILDEDDLHLTRVLLRDGVVIQWLHVNKKDLEQEIFARQWRQALATTDPERRLTVSRHNSEEVFREAIAQKSASGEYFFFPAGALQARRQVEKGKRVMIGLGVVAVLLLLGCLPFLFQTFETFRLQARLSDQRELSRAAREDRQVVQNFEQQWGVITNFPRQDLVQTLFTLQSVLSPEQLTSFELSEGVIQIEGESAEPQAILQRLESHPMFTEVAFARATNNARYYIDLRLSTVNFEGYMVRYFPGN
jgi:hypothetical protein